MSHPITLSPARAELNFLLHSHAQKKKVKIIEAPHTIRSSRHRELSSHSLLVERYRCEGIITMHPKDDNKSHALLEQVHVPRESNFLPLVRAPTPYYPREVEEQQQQQDGKKKKGVRWTDPLERPATGKGFPGVRVRSVLKKTDAVVGGKSRKWWYLR
ncbi:hypothetical protein NEUTE1DRAFT_138166 [Neurospora tetrasperma FGSC 2508]|uniref:Uncharacterized protein n=1 Tax=Neurospora tetrasperma (strain FGSC 2508 / ATCC MYA-4615 / P0657) TaxID=510951 RepID=F8MLM0_NEUT8|nr:uncharacterized protein NEUTE1DRAFT_138166 [Neurospora tetrasperma FGSC 2508]EGO58439.1 hypothetical protein NEUTE1DRAFT_138166 [Neurospora tetrasperma FGSC 2508]EGZ71227.1 hypothetical protein NEUTE2DRAFT_166308 [Neurospora tetrasperma FGSC 2509]